MAVLSYWHPFFHIDPFPFMIHWTMLLPAIATEVAGTSMTEISDGFGKPLFAVGAFVRCGISLTLLTTALKQFEVSMAYAIRSGLGISAISITGIRYFRESIDPLKVISPLPVIAGIVGLNFAQK